MNFWTFFQNCFMNYWNFWNAPHKNGKFCVVMVFELKERFVCTKNFINYLSFDLFLAILTWIFLKFHPSSPRTNELCDFAGIVSSKRIHYTTKMVLNFYTCERNAYTVLITPKIIKFMTREGMFERVCGGYFRSLVSIRVKFSVANNWKYYHRQFSLGCKISRRTEKDLYGRGNEKRDADMAESVCGFVW